MPYIDAVIFTKWIEGEKMPNALLDVSAWALANGEYLPQPLFGSHPCGLVYQDLTGQANIHQRILDDLAVFVAKIQIAVATAQQFASDNRIWTLGYWRRDDEGEVIDSNWNGPLTPDERQQAVSYITTNSAITAQQLAAVFAPTDTMAEIAHKLKVFFRE